MRSLLLGQLNRNFQRQIHQMLKLVIQLSATSSLLFQAQPDVDLGRFVVFRYYDRRFTTVLFGFATTAAGRLFSFSSLCFLRGGFGGNTFRQTVGFRRRHFIREPRWRRDVMGICPCQFFRIRKTTARLPALIRILATAATSLARKRDGRVFLHDYRHRPINRAGD